MSLQYLAIRPGDYEQVRQFVSASGWSKRVQDPAKFQKMMDRADRTVVVWDGSQVIGFARALCDDVSNGYISLLAVAPEYRGQGIGAEIVRRLIGDDHDITWVLRAGRESRGFWEKQGFALSEIAMERLRG
jgi:GNAT superfamily N-acetyltransferase